MHIVNDMNKPMNHEEQLEYHKQMQVQRYDELLLFLHTMLHLVEEDQHTLDLIII
jgi:hypothetical protein